MIVEMIESRSVTSLADEILRQSIESLSIITKWIPFTFKLNSIPTLQICFFAEQYDAQIGKADAHDGEVDSH